MLILALTIWFSTVEFFVKKSGKMQYYDTVYSLALTLEMLEIILKVVEIKCFSSTEQTLASLIKTFHATAYCSVFLVLKLGALEEKRQHVWVVLEVAAVYFMSQRIVKIFESLRFYYFALRYEYQAKIVDLILKIFIYTHFLVRPVRDRPSRSSWPAAATPPTTGSPPSASTPTTRSPSTSTPTTSPPLPSSPSATATSLPATSPRSPSWCWSKSSVRLP